MTDKKNIIDVQFETDNPNNQKTQSNSTRNNLGKIKFSKLFTIRSLIMLPFILVIFILVFTIGFIFLILFSPKIIRALRKGGTQPIKKWIFMTKKSFHDYKNVKKNMKR